MLTAYKGYFRDGQFIVPEADKIPNNVEVYITITENIITEKNLDEQIMEIIERKNIPNITLEADENGNAYIDKEKYPELYDWAVNG